MLAKSTVLYWNMLLFCMYYIMPKKYAGIIRQGLTGSGLSSGHYALLSVATVPFLTLRDLSASSPLKPELGYIPQVHAFPH